MGAVELTGPLTQPDEVRRRVIGQAGPRVDPRQGVLIVQQEGLVGREELGGAHRLEVGPTGGHELHRFADVVRQPLVAAVGGALDEALVPVVHVPQVGESACREGAHEVEVAEARWYAVTNLCGSGTRALGSKAKSLTMSPR